ncbi:autophagy protein 5 [Coemansia spiralis]|uniref:Autophagy protein 5 n=2 Tax=Coemansia TaxID=4863 RepID=A0A9W8KVJ2_9FUNG|nr:autophagy protein Apg5-domain-containing protein [Coemansia spiralis]KAJ1987462.1 autophagy protein 5 [Coemansia umbellata]KAJ2619301.1 autophagy protein 5 [Coemansia sp. RSA 1358]KAJ2674015.1 autophagy protein 5 [Coemansia spiralis]
MEPTVQKIWNGMIPIELQLAAADAIELLASAVLPEPFQTFYMLVPRVGYLPFTTARIKEQWLDPMLEMSGSRTQNVKETEFWFEYNKQPLKWHYPVGLLYDMLVREPELPWSLTLHVRKYPTPKLIPSPSIQSMRDMFMAMIKEADFIRNGSTKRVMDLAKSDQMQLLDGLQDHSFEKYFAIHSIIVPASKGAKTKSLKAVPLRFYMASGGQEDSAKEAPDISQFHVSQFPVPLTKEGSTDLLVLADAFRVCYEIDQSGDAFVTNCACICQGVSIPWETPISWLVDNFFYADCFLHLVVLNTVS